METLIDLMLFFGGMVIGALLRSLFEKDRRKV